MLNSDAKEYLIDMAIGLPSNKNHVRPDRAAIIIDPYNDLVCLCANCHRMMHRNSGHVMTVEELKRAYRE